MRADARGERRHDRHGGMIGTALGLLLALLGLALPVAAALALLGGLLGALFTPIPLHLALGEIAWSASTNALLVSVPLFVLLGEILLRSGIADRLYGSMAAWLSWLPGGLMHANIGACMAFAATSGSSVATAATIGTVAMPQIRRFNYPEPLFLGSLAAGGTLGILIPPSINMIIYGWLTQTSVPQLYLAGFVPGIVLGLIFMATLVTYYLIYEGLHTLHHLPGTRRGVTGWMQRHHARHHDAARMRAGNWNVSFPLWDVLLGTTLTAKDPPPPPA